jgi:hypothetical protein
MPDCVFKTDSRQHVSVSDVTNCYSPTNYFPQLAEATIADPTDGTPKSGQDQDLQKSLSCLTESSFVNQSVPEVIEKSGSSTLKIFFEGHGDKHACSATRVANNIILSAAHCFQGFFGDKKLEDVKPSYIVHEGVKHSLRIIEAGQYSLVQGGLPEIFTSDTKLQDWILLESEDGARSLKGIGIAKFPSADELQDVINDRRDFGECDGGTPIWTITYPKSMIRIYPRPSNAEEGSVFYSRGQLMTDEAYKTSVIYMLREQSVFDDQYGMSIPDYAIDVDAEWERLHDIKELKLEAGKMPSENDLLPFGIYRTYELYEESGDPILYHSADINEKSSGGGVFVESSGHYLGFISMGVGKGSRSEMYGGDYHLFRVDKVCEQSKVMARLKKCRDLLRGQ